MNLKISIARIPWWIYYVFITVLILSGVIYVLPNNPDLYQIQYLVFQVLSIIALQGYITRRHYFHHLVWKITLAGLLINIAYELYLYATFELPPHNMLRQFLLMAGIDIHFNNSINALLSATRDGLILPLIYALSRYTIQFRASEIRHKQVD